VHDDIGYYGLGVMWVDYDDDGWPDLLVANDSVPNYLYHNNHNGTFTEMGMLTGVALSGEGMELGNSGRRLGRLRPQWPPQLFRHALRGAANSLYRNMGPQGFDDVSWTSNVGQPSYPYVVGAPLFSIWTTTPGSTFSSPTATSIRRSIRWKPDRVFASRSCCIAIIVTARLMKFPSKQPPGFAFEVPPWRCLR